MNDDDHRANRDTNSKRRPSGGGRYSIGELAALGGVSRRTVRYYVQRGLLEAPTGLGRGRHYTDRHLGTLIRIRELQQAGRPLVEIAAELASPEAPRAVSRARDLPAPDRLSRWTRLEIDDGVELHLRDMALTPRQARSAIDAIRRIIRQGGR